jgi:hypothetical protein
LGSISRRGDPYLRTLLIHGARSVLCHTKAPSAFGMSLSIAMCADQPHWLQSGFRHTTRWPMNSYRTSCGPRQRTNRCRPSCAFRWPSPVGATQRARPSFLPASLFR